MSKIRGKEREDRSIVDKREKEKQDTWDERMKGTGME